MIFIKKKKKKKKIHGNIIFSSKALKRWSFQKTFAVEYDLFLSSPEKKCTFKDN